MAPPLLKCSEIALTFGGTPLLTGADMQVHGGDRICLVGRNGSGKSTFLKIAAGLVEPDDGERFLQPGIHAAYLQQEPDFGDAETANDYASSGFAEFEDPYPARAMLEELGLDPEARLATLSGGEARRAALVRALAPQPDILMLDEPTNHLDLPTIAWLERTLAAARAALILISHDRRFLEALSQTTVWLDRGKTRRLDKGFDAFEAWRDTVLEQEALDAHKRDRAIAREEDWMQGGVSGRRKRNMRRVAELHALRKERQTAQASVGTVKLEASDAQASGKLVCEAAGITHSYDGGAPIIRDVSLRIMRGDRLGLVGPNGAGKTTLLKILIGELQPSAGTIRHGANLETVWL
ncbi:MAG: ABC-F family ATP-binding cassette domain-containing protein, partial [Pseudomonadota bacterium]